MAITSSSFGRFKRGNAPVMGGMRMVTPKVTANLLKSVDAINKNLVAINKLLSQQAGIKAAQQQKQQEETSRKAENLRRFNIESALEAPKKIAGFITNAIARPAKSIFNTIRQFLDPFIKFFTLTFIGWFTNGVIKWFQQNKEAKQNQLKQFIPKIMTALTIAGGVLLAIQVGIPIILGTLSAIVTTLPILMGALLNPVTWVTLLGVGTGILLFEGGEAALEGLRPGQRARARVRKTAVQGLTPLDELSTERGRIYKKDNPMEQVIGLRGVQNFVKLNNSYISKDDYRRIENGEFDFLATKYEKKGPEKFVMAGQTRLNAQTLASGSDDTSKNALIRVQANKLGSFYENYVRDRDALASAKTKRDYDANEYKKYLDNQMRGGKTAEELLKNDPSLRRLKTNADASERQYTNVLNTFNRTQNTMKALYDKLPEQSRRYLENDLGITRQNIYDPKMLETGQADYSFNRFGRALINTVANSEIFTTIEGQIDSLRTNISQIVDSGVDIIANIQIKPDYQEGSGNDPIDLGPPVGISPFNMEDPFLQYSKKMYNAWGVI